jgi:membrane-associated phospholipid phosphatase
MRGESLLRLRDVTPKISDNSSRGLLLSRATQPRHYDVSTRIRDLEMIVNLGPLQRQGTPRLLQETATGRLTVRQVFPPRVAIARGHNAIVLFAVALSWFAVVLAYVKFNRGQQLDLRVTRSMQRMRGGPLPAILRAVSWPGFPPQSRIIPVLMSLIWLALGFPIEAAFQFLAWGAGFLSMSIKSVLRRPRPTADQVRVSPAHLGDTSFPSGHVLIYTSVYGFLAFLISTLVRSNTWRRVGIWLLTSLVALVGPSRIYLGHHWFTDVVASYLLGTSMLLANAAIYRRVKTRWLNLRRRPVT